MFSSNRLLVLLYSSKSSFFKKYFFLHIDTHTWSAYKLYTYVGKRRTVHKDFRMAMAVLPSPFTVVVLHTWGVQFVRFPLLETSGGWQGWARSLYRAQVTWQSHDHHLTKHQFLGQYHKQVYWERVLVYQVETGCRPCQRFMSLLKMRPIKWVADTNDKFLCLWHIVTITWQTITVRRDPW